MDGTTAVAQSVRQARERAQLSQTELARRSGVPQPHISLIEAGKVEPTVQTVDRLLDAARVRPSALVDRHRSTIREIVAKRHGRNVRVFGSVARGDDDYDSDVDLLVDFDERTSIFTVAGLARELEELLGTRVDVVSNGGRDTQTLRAARSEAVPL